MKLVIVGASYIAEVAYEYFTADSDHEVVAFAVERSALERHRLFGLPVVAFEDVETLYPPDTHGAFIATGYAQLNRVRERLYLEAKAKGYSLASYVSSRAFVWRNVTLGDNCFILENNVLQPFVTIGNNVTLWSGNHIGHHASIGDHVFIASHVVLSGLVKVGAYCFFGVNSAVADNVTIGADSLIGAGATILRDAVGGKIYAMEGTKPRGDALAFFGVEGHE
jgi:sugar O-acyltransferase (sialic acid O-acetyltransferase NeuD family)